MSSTHGTDRAHQHYRDELLLALRLHDVPGPRIGEVLAEVESHTRATGEPPLEAFGPPKAYAAQVADALGAPTGGWWAFLRRDWVRRQALGVLASAVGGFLLASGLVALGAGESAVVGLPALLAVVLGLLVLGVSVGRHTARRARANPVIDPRTGDRVQVNGERRGAVLIAVAVMVAMAGLVLLGTLIPS